MYFESSYEYTYSSCPILTPFTLFIRSVPVVNSFGVLQYLVEGDDDKLDELDADLSFDNDPVIVSALREYGVSKVSLS